MTNKNESLEELVKQREELDERIKRAEIDEAKKTLESKIGRVYKCTPHWAEASYVMPYAVNTESPDTLSCYIIKVGAPRSPASYAVYIETTIEVHELVEEAHGYEFLNIYDDLMKKMNDLRGFVK